MDLKKPLKFQPNIRSEKATAKTGYTWGKLAAESNILKLLPEDNRQTLEIEKDDIVAERWLCTDDRGFPSQVLNLGEPVGFDLLLEKKGAEVVGPQHLKEFGPYLGSIMKQLDTNTQPNKGSLSVQLHPKPGHPTRPSKPEMWQGAGSVYLGWNQNMTPDKIKQAINNNQLESYMNIIDLTPKKLILVTGGLIHAIRYNSFLSEWSMAPGKDDISKGNIKDATVAPYDRTDGKTPRPGKENFEGSIEVMKDADTFGAIEEKQLITKPAILTKDQNQMHLALFRTSVVFVDEHHLHQQMTFSLEDRGKPLFLKQGSLTIKSNGTVIDKIESGEERYFPFALREVEIVSTGQVPAIFNVWYTPFTSEKEKLT